MTSPPSLERRSLSPDVDAADLAAMLAQSDRLLVREGPRPEVVVGSPHHAPKGVPFLYRGRVADENAGRLALLVSEALGARAVVACRATNHDPNKVEGPYLEAVLAPPLRVLVEIHGHAGVRPPGRRQRARHDVEVSTGARRTQAFAVAFVERLRARVDEALDGDATRGGLSQTEAEAVRSLDVSAAWDAIFLRATGTLSLRRARERGALALHVELPRALRIDPRHDGLPPAGVLYARSIARAVGDVLDPS